MQRKASKMSPLAAKNVVTLEKLAEETEIIDGNYILQYVQIVVLKHRYLLFLEMTDQSIAEIAIKIIDKLVTKPRIIFGVFLCVFLIVEFCLIFYTTIGYSKQKFQFSTV